MKQYKFTVEAKIKYVKIAEFKGLKIPILNFSDKFSQI